jgi:hypothetical protein
LGAALLPGLLEEHYFAFAVVFSEDQSCARIVFELHDLEPKPDERPQQMRNTGTSTGRNAL